MKGPVPQQMVRGAPQRQKKEYLGWQVLQQQLLQVSLAAHFLMLLLLLLLLLLLVMMMMMMMMMILLGVLVLGTGMAMTMMMVMMVMMMVMMMVVVEALPKTVLIEVMVRRAMSHAASGRQFASVLLRRQERGNLLTCIASACWC